jgi:hypothetical protein
MTVGFERVKTQGRSFSELIQRKRSVVEVTVEENCVAHAIVIAIAEINNDPHYESYRKKGHQPILPAVQNLLAATGIDLRRGGALPELARFQEHLINYRIVV